LQGNGGNDSFVSGDGNDTLIGGANNDTLLGGNGDDTYIFNTGSGQDIVDDGPADLFAEDGSPLDGGNDTIQFGSGISWSDLTLTASANNLLIQSGEDQIEIQDQLNSYSGAGRIENLEFTDGTDFNFQAGSAEANMLTGSVNHSIIFGNAGNDVLTGSGLSDYLSCDTGNDQLIGNAGNDTLKGGDGADQLDGGADNDLLDGGSGNDRYTFDVGDGQDTIEDGSGYDTLVLGGGISLDNVFVLNNSDNTSTILLNGNPDDEITLIGNIEKIQASTLNQNSFFKSIITSASRDEFNNVYGTSKNDLVYLQDKPGEEPGYPVNWYDGIHSLVDDGQGHDTTYLGLSTGSDRIDLRSV
jgi:Ca2+-binding RTX toxin-like protein